MTSFARRAAGWLAAGALVGAASCQLVAGIEPWAATGSGGSSTSSTGATSTGDGCVCATDCFGAACTCAGCAPREVKPPGQPTCNKGAARCLGVAQDHVMVITRATVGDAVTLLPKDPTATFTTVLSGVGVRDVATYAGAGYALGFTGLYKGSFSGVWPEKPIITLSGAPEYLRVLRFGGSDILTYIDQSDGVPAGLYSIDEAQMSVKNQLNSTYVGVATDGAAGYAAIAATPSSPVTRFPQNFLSAGIDIDVPGAVVDFTGGEQHLYAALADGTVRARDTSSDDGYVDAPASTEFAKTTRLKWTPKWVYGSDDRGHLYRFSSDAPYEVDTTFTQQTGDVRDIAVDAAGVYWVSSDDSVYMLSTEND